MLSPGLLSPCFSCAAPAIISELFSNRLHPLTDVYDGIIVPVIFEFTGTDYRLRIRTGETWIELICLCGIGQCKHALSPTLTQSFRPQIQSCNFSSGAISHASPPTSSIAFIASYAINVVYYISVKLKDL